MVLRPAPGTARRRWWWCAWTWRASRTLRSDDELRRILFSRRPGEASAANYYYEISKGSLELEEGALLHLDPPWPMGRPGAAGGLAPGASSWCAGPWSSSRTWT